MRKIVVLDENGLHARPASDIVNLTSQYSGDVYLIKNGEKGDAKSIMMLMALGIVQGDSVDIIAEGEDSAKMELEIENIILNSDR